MTCEEQEANEPATEKVCNPVSIKTLNPGGIPESHETDRKRICNQNNNKTFKNSFFRCKKATVLNDVMAIFETCYIQYVCKFALPCRKM